MGGGSTSAIFGPPRHDPGRTENKKPRGLATSFGISLSGHEIQQVSSLGIVLVALKLNPRWTDRQRSLSNRVPLAPFGYGALKRSSNTLYVPMIFMGVRRYPSDPIMRSLLGDNGLASQLRECTLTDKKKLS
ncbi:hypothetical protein EVAR_28517_1 [Eumeta japonica]|uniref:Uncharacterized protein n=1 Tax=Eumeta variegata TaxID=151549 RepID=A0A4C1WSS0_EUMVA|nr:hypothetical protein EVAR_28517_1 [Eumeta japonica]